MYSEEMFLDTLLWQFTPTILMTLFYSILLWIAGEHRFNPLSSSSARTSILWGLRLEFLSEPLEIGLIKCLTLSEYWLQHPSSTHSRWSRPSHLYIHLCFLCPKPSPPFSSIACLPFLHPPISYTKLHSLSLWNSSSPTHLAFPRACALSFQGGASFTRQSKNKWWSAVQRVGSSSSVNMADWTQAEGKYASV